MLDFMQLNIVQGRILHSSRELVEILHTYAVEHEGRYPDGLTANDAFRFLFKGGYTDDESLFTAPGSPFIVDNDIGVAPNYAQALEAGENHWAMVKGLTLNTDGKIPLIFENPKVATWPPQWDVKTPGQDKRGRMWRDATVLVARCDGSVKMERLAVGESSTATLKAVKDGKNIFELAGPHEILDVED